MGDDTLFRKSSLNSISSPDRLNDYIKVSNPGVWLVLAALFMLLAAVLVWGVTGGLPTALSARGAARDGNIVCYINVDDADAVELEQSASITSGDGVTHRERVVDIGDMPMSAAEITAGLNSEYLAYALVFGQFTIKLTIAVDTSAIADGALLDVKIVTDTVRPIDFLLGR